MRNNLAAMYKAKTMKRHAIAMYITQPLFVSRKMKKMDIINTITTVHIILDDLQSVLSTKVGNIKFHAAMCTAPNTMPPSEIPKNSAERLGSFLVK